MDVIEQKTKLLMKEWMSNSMDTVDGVGESTKYFLIYHEYWIRNDLVWVNGQLWTHIRGGKGNSTDHNLNININWT